MPGQGQGNVGPGQCRAEPVRVGTCRAGAVSPGHVARPRPCVARPCRVCQVCRCWPRSNRTVPSYSAIEPSSRARCADMRCAALADAHQRVLSAFAVSWGSRELVGVGDGRARTSRRRRGRVMGDRTLAGLQSSRGMRRCKTPRAQDILWHQTAEWPRFVVRCGTQQPMGMVCSSMVCCTL